MNDRTVIMMALISLVSAAALTAAAAFILSFVPPSAPLAVDVFPEFAEYLRPEWETVLYRLFVGFAIVMQAVLVWQYVRKSK